MENKFNEATPQRPEGDRPLDATMVIMDLPSFMEQIKQESSWKDGDRNSITIFKTDGMRIVMIALHEGAELKTHSAAGIISVQVLEGQMRFTTEQQTTELNKGQMLALHEGIAHSVLANMETVFLLTLAIKKQKAN
ncbi:cupin domain-containing protein [Pedobacter nutrimenti]|uniref:Quercetin dioxygenase-like cupin family protein n=1 Tax=Pedobacter nutrimenti TaxID=1241337 RepID=A0A318UBB6_9SPHI|nr:cupin domain-containing protein [Pedobacter nutrimenti]PYF70626.1 quercetin dioxygenase-like cupin family protein [Pedobacter nutrimenti]